MEWKQIEILQLLIQLTNRMVWFKLHDEVSRVFKAIGFTYVTMDLLGYRMGSMDEVLSKDQLEM